MCCMISCLALSSRVFSLYCSFLSMSFGWLAVKTTFKITLNCLGWAAMLYSLAPKSFSILPYTGCHATYRLFFDKRRLSGVGLVCFSDYRYYNDIHAFNTETYQWIKLDVSGIPPCARSGACIISVCVCLCAIGVLSTTDSQRNVQLLTCTEHDQPVILVC